MQESVEPLSTIPRHILVIEDEHFISELYTRALSKAGYEVTVKFDGQSGLSAAQTDAFDIILLDLMVPNITGIEILRTLRDSNKTPKLHAKIIVTTNLEQRDEVREAIESQADGYIVKASITPRQLVEFLSRLENTPA